MANFINRDFQAATHDPALCKALVNKLEDMLAGRQFRFMEVCGTHTAAIFQSGIRSMLPKNIIHLSGPGCPVCVTDEAEVEHFLAIAQEPDAIVATFGDLLRVPGAKGNSLRHAKARGGQVEIIYSPLDCLTLAQKYPDKQIVFLGVGFETTAPAVAAAILKAKASGIENFSVLSLHKLVPPVLRSLLSNQNNLMDAFLLPGHVAVITGLGPFAFLPEEFHMPAVVAGFEPLDILLAINQLADMHVSGHMRLKNAYDRAVKPEGNPEARKILESVFEVCDSSWRGLGVIPQGGLVIRAKYEDFDASRKFPFSLPAASKIPGCQCGLVLQGRITPPQCPLFGKKCAPENPVGPCMVSTEGSCAAFYKYGEN